MGAGKFCLTVSQPCRSDDPRYPQISEPEATCRAVCAVATAAGGLALNGCSQNGRLDVATAKKVSISPSSVAVGDSILSF